MRHKLLQKNRSAVVRTDLQIDAPGVTKTDWAVVKGELVEVNGQLILLDSSVAKHSIGGRVLVVLQNMSDKENELKKGDKIGKLMFVHAREDLKEKLFDNILQQLKEDLTKELFDSAPQHLKEEIFGG